MFFFLNHDFSFDANIWIHCNDVCVGQDRARVAQTPSRCWQEQDAPGHPGALNQSSHGFNLFPYGKSLKKYRWFYRIFSPFRSRIYHDGTTGLSEPGSRASWPNICRSVAMAWWKVELAMFAQWLRSTLLFIADEFGVILWYYPIYWGLSQCMNW